MSNLNSDMNLDEKIENEIMNDENENIKVYLIKANCLEGIKECKTNIDNNLIDENELIIMKENSNQNNESLPIRMAKEQIMKMEEDMKKIHERSLKIVRELNNSYIEIEEEIRQHYDLFLEKFREVTQQKIQSYKNAYEIIKQEKEDIEARSNNQIIQLTEKNEILRYELENFAKKYKEDIDIIKQESEIKIKSENHEEEIQKLKQKINEANMNTEDLLTQNYINCQKIIDKEINRTNYREMEMNTIIHHGINDISNLLVSNIILKLDSNAKDNIIENWKSKNQFLYSKINELDSIQHINKDLMSQKEYLKSRVKDLEIMIEQIKKDFQIEKEILEKKISIQSQNSQNIKKLHIIKNMENPILKDKKEELKRNHSQGDNLIKKNNSEKDEKPHKSNLLILIENKKIERNNFKKKYYEWFNKFKENNQREPNKKETEPYNELRVKINNLGNEIKALEKASYEQRNNSLLVIQKKHINQSNLSPNLSISISNTTLIEDKTINDSKINDSNFLAENISKIISDSSLNPAPILKHKEENYIYEEMQKQNQSLAVVNKNYERLKNEFRLLKEKYSRVMRANKEDLIKTEFLKVLEENKSLFDHNRIYENKIIQLSTQIQNLNCISNEILFFKELNKHYFEIFKKFDNSLQNFLQFKERFISMKDNPIMQNSRSDISIISKNLNEIQKVYNEIKEGMNKIFTATAPKIKLENSNLNFKDEIENLKSQILSLENTITFLRNEILVSIQLNKDINDSLKIDYRNILQSSFNEKLKSEELIEKNKLLENELVLLRKIKNNFDSLSNKSKENYINEANSISNLINFSLIKDITENFKLKIKNVISEENLINSKINLNICSEFQIYTSQVESLFNSSVEINKYRNYKSNQNEFPNELESIKDVKSKSNQENNFELFPSNHKSENLNEMSQEIFILRFQLFKFYQFNEKANYDNLFQNEINSLLKENEKLCSINTELNKKQKEANHLLEIIDNLKINLKKEKAKNIEWETKNSVFIKTHEEKNQQNENNMKSVQNIIDKLKKEIESEKERTNILLKDQKLKLENLFKNDLEKERKINDEIVKKLKTEKDMLEKEYKRTLEKLFLLQKEKEEIDSKFIKSNLNLENLNEELKEIKKINSKAVDTEKELSKKINENKSLQESYFKIEELWKKEMCERKRLHNQVEDMKGRIRVFCRVRPLNEKEIKMNYNFNIIFDNDFPRLTVKKKDGALNSFLFDIVYRPLSTQAEIFLETKRLIQSAIDGYNVCIFAYGQTGSGKTYTIHGNENEKGITPRAFEEVFSLIKFKANLIFNIECYMVELYIDKLTDLLLPKNLRKNPPKLEIKEDTREMIYIQNITV